MSKVKEVSDEQMIGIVSPIVSELGLFAKELNNMIAKFIDTYDRKPSNRQNIEALQSLQELMDHPFFLGSKYYPQLNMAYQVLFDNAQTNIRAKIAEETEALNNFAPKRGRKPSL